VDEERLRQIESEERARMEIRDRLEAERATAASTAEASRVPEQTDKGWAPPLGFPPPGTVPPYPPPGFDPRGYAPAVPATKTNGLAIAGMVLGILWLYWIGSILALIFGYVAKGQIDASNGQQGGRGMAIAAIVLGWVGIGVFVLLLILGVGVASGA
jgi:hypothetical protein